MLAMMQGKEKETARNERKDPPPSWSRTDAERQAREEGVELTAYHWEIILFLQDYYKKNQMPLKVKELMKEVGRQLGAEKGSARYLYRLFPNGPSIQGARIAGVPLPADDIDW